MSDSRKLPKDEMVASSSATAQPTSADYQRQRRASIELYASVLENLPAFIVCKDVEGRFVYVNDQFAKREGLSVAEIVGKTDYDLYESDRADRYRAEDRRVMDAGVLFEDVEETVHGDTKTYLQVRKAPLRDFEGNLIGIQAIFWDVTRRQLAENKSAAEHRMLRTIMDHLPDHIYVKDTNGRYIIVNEATKTALGAQSVDRACGRTSADFLGPEFGERQRIDDWRVLQSRKPLVDREDKLRFEDGDIKWILTTKIPLEDSEGRVTGLVGIDRNITHLKQSELDLRAAKDAADAANKAKGDFLANMSHEIRTPMNAIIGMTDLLLTTEITDAQREYLRMVQQSGESLLTLINEILDFSKIEAGKFALHETDFCLLECVGDTMKSLALRAANKNLELACHVADDVPTWVHGDDGRLRQVITNLVGNAIKFTENGEVVLRVRRASSESEACSIENDHLRLLFSVVDTGIGIPPEKCDSIFDEFEQADTSTTRRFGGTGLGLAISSKLIALMGGKIWVESQEAVGSDFSFTVCFSEPHEIVEENPLDDAPLKGARVLVVDDNSTCRDILSRMLTGWGLDVVASGRVMDAKRICRGISESVGPSFDLVVADAHLASTGQLDFLPSLCESKGGVAKSIVLASAPSPELNAQCDQLAVSACLLKPVKSSELKRAAIVALSHNSDRFQAERASQTSVRADWHVLVAEDNLVNQQLAIGALDTLGYRVTLANNGLEAVELSRQHEFDAILMDIQMPELDGIEATQEIRERERSLGSERIPIVAMTAHAMAEDRVLCLQSGMDYFLPKPVRLNLLRDLLSEIFAQRGHVAGGAHPHDPKSFANNARSASSGTPAMLTVENAASANERGEEDSLVDWDHALKGVANSKPLLHAVMKAFIDDKPRLMMDMRKAWESRESEALKRAAHSVKGALLFLNTKPVIELARSIEEDAAHGIVDGNAERLDALEAGMQQVVTVLQRRLENR